MMPKLSWALLLSICATAGIAAESSSLSPSLRTSSNQPILLFDAQRPAARPELRISAVPEATSLARTPIYLPLSQDQRRQAKEMIQDQKVEEQDNAEPKESLD